MKKIFLSVCILAASFYGNGQGFNNNSQKSYINVAMPKTPESQSFEKYGNVPLDEFSGTTSISVPVCNLQSKFLNAGVSLSYHSSGIKVSQEATWVGLGFDLMCGGRITVETKGNVDENVRNLTEQSFFKAGIPRIFNKWKVPYTPSPNAPQLGYAFLDYAKYYGTNITPYDHVNDTLWDDNFTVSNAAWYGAGEPDIYHANFLGNSVSFYFDLVDGHAKFIGEKSLFGVTVTSDGTGKTSSFIITDNSGVKYYFEQPEKTKLSVSPNYAFASSVESNVAWLLTKIVHPTSDNILFSYTNYGKTYPAFTWSASYSTNLPYTGVTPSNELPNQVEQDPYYLTKIESSSTSVDFFLSGREDLRGAGAKKLDKIEVKDKSTNTVVKQVLFTYDYFTATLEPYENTLADTIKSYYGKRLRLLSVKDNSAPGSNPWLFKYKNQAGPSKLSFSQDHWGYYNGAANSFYGTYPPTTSPLRLIPSFSSLGNLETRAIGAKIYAYTINMGGNPSLPVLDGATSAATIPTGLDGTADRNCSPQHLQAYMMDSVIYPTGGSAKLEYEPHHSYYGNKNITDFVGGGLRIKSVKTYSDSGKLVNTTEYDYMNSGVYLGAIEYIRIATKWPSGQSMTLSTSGDMNNDKQYVGYASVKTTIKDYTNQVNNGYTIKYYKVGDPLQPVYSNVMHPFTPYYFNGGDCGTTDKSFLLKQWSANGPVPKSDLDGKMYLQEMYNNLGTKVKFTNYYYRQAQQTNDFYSLKVADNYNGYPGVLGFMQGNQVGNFDLGKGVDGNCYIRWIRWEVCINPALAYFTVLDSVVDKTLGNSGAFITEKKTFAYNSFSQQEFASTYNSDGTQSIIYTKTPLSFARPYIPSGGENEALGIEQMKSNHIYDLPIEQVTIKRTAAGDSLVTGSVHNVYNLASLKKVDLLETNTPLLLRTQFVPAYYYYNYPTLPSFNVITDPKYKLQETAEYNTSGQVKDIVTTKGKKTFIWDETNNQLMAACTEGTSADIAYSSFETTATGNWTYAGTPLVDAASPTGGKVYKLNTGSITKSTTDAAKTYILSYWSRAGATITITGGTILSNISGRSVDYWTYKETRISGASSISLSGSGLIDELRLYPENTLMNSYTYKPAIGISSQCDVNNRISYYEYDAAGRLVLIRDQENKIIKKICYNNAGQPQDCSLTYNPPPVCNGVNCTGVDKKCLYGICETGERINQLALYKRGVWTCYFIYRWSDGSESPQYTETSSTPCPLNPN